MADARGTQAQVRLATTLPEAAGQLAGSEVTLQANGRVIDFPGFRRAYVEGADDPEAELAETERVLPSLTEHDTVGVVSAEAKDHTTQPPARFTDASLVKKMEELGIGRPSTYASVISTIQDRGYVWKKGSALVPSFTAFAVVKLLEEHFAELVDYSFTAAMEDDLDAIASGTEESLPWLSRFYFGHDPDGVAGFGLKQAVTDHLPEIDPVEINSIPIGPDPTSGEPIVVRVGKFGPYLKRGDDTTSLRDDMLPDELTPVEAAMLLDAPQGDRSVGIDPASGLEIFVKAGRFGPYIQLGELTEGGEKPKTASLLSTMTVETLSFDEALQLLELPRLVGLDPESGEEIRSLNGRFGPYLTRSKDSRSLTTEAEMFTVTLDEALALFAQPKRGRGRVAAPPLKELGDDPVSGEPVVVKDGRFGPYVTDGTTNASLRTGDSVESITIERAAELLEIRRAAGPAKKKKTTKKKATKKRAAKKKAPAKKAAAKKAVAKKAPAKMAVASPPVATGTDAGAEAADAAG